MTNIFAYWFKQWYKEVALIGSDLATLNSKDFNNWAEWKNFLSRYLAIWWVTMIRSLVFSLLPAMVISGIVSGILAMILWENSNFDLEPIFVWLFAMLYFLGYVYMNIKYWKQLMKKIEKKNSK